MKENENKTGTLIEKTESKDDEIDLLALLLCLVDKIKYIVAVAMIGALLMGIYSFWIATPIYESTSKLYVVNSSGSAINLSDLQIGNYLASDYREVFDTWEVQEMVLQNLNLDYSYRQLRSMINVTNPNDTRILRITASSASPQEAADLANEFARVGQKYITEMMETDEPNILSVALVPQTPSSPHKFRNIVIGMLLGALVACAYFVIRFLMDDRVMNADDITKSVGLSVLAVVPVNSSSSGAKSTQKDKKKDR